MACRSCEEARRRTREAFGHIRAGNIGQAAGAASQAGAAVVQKITDEAARVRELLRR
jgi:hypothetical protein